MAPALEENAKLQNMSKNMNSHEETRVRKTAGTWGYALQIIYQVSVLQQCHFVLERFNTIL